MLTQTAPAESRTATLAAVRARWNEILAEPIYWRIDGRVESNGLGETIFMTPPKRPHSSRQRRIERLLEELLGGLAFPELPVLTTDGVKGLDVGWFTVDRHDRLEDPDVCEFAPEICVEVRSRSNTQAEIDHKRGLYFGMGATEVWVCQLDGMMTFYHRDEPDRVIATSKVCPNFPRQVV